MSSLQTAVKRSASTDAEKRRRLHFFHRIGSPPSRNRPKSDNCQQHLLSSAADEEGDVNDGWGSQACNVMREADSPELCGEPDTMRLHQFGSGAVAVELCLLDGEILRKIEPEELYNGAWMKKEKEQLAPNVLSMVRTSNELAMMVPSEILEETTTHGRAKIISSFIKIASKLHHLRNYNSLKAVLAGLQCTPIFRLKKTWKEVPSKRKKKFEKLSDLMSEEYNWRNYRAELEDCFSKNIPCIPFLGVLLTTIVQRETVGTPCGGQVTRHGRKRISGVEMYTILEAITVRNRLEKLRKQSSNWRLSGIPSADVKRPTFVRSQSHFAKSSHTVISDSNIGIMSEVNESDKLNVGNKRSILVGDSSGSEDEEKWDTIIGTSRITEEGQNKETESAETGRTMDTSSEEHGISGTTSSSDSENTPNLSPILLPRSSRLCGSDRAFSLKKKKLKRLAVSKTLTEPFSSNSKESTLQPRSPMKNSVSDSVVLDGVINYPHSSELFNDFSGDGSSNAGTPDACHDPLPNEHREETGGAADNCVDPLPKVYSLEMRDTLGTEVSLCHVPIPMDAFNKTVTACNRLTVNGASQSDGNLNRQGDIVRSGSADRMRKVTVLDPPSIEDLYESHFREYAEVSRSLESLTEACDDLSRGPMAVESTDFLLKHVNGELLSFVPKSLSLQSLSSIDGSLESHSGSSFASSNSDTSSQPSSSNLISPIKTCPASLLDRRPNNNAFEDSAISDDIIASDDSDVSKRQRLRSNSVDDVFVETESDHNMTKTQCRRRSSDCTASVRNNNMTSSVTSQNEADDRRPTVNSNSRKLSYGPVRRRSRRKASLVLRLAQLGTEEKTFSSDDHLMKYKFMSLRYSSDYETLPELRILLTVRKRNTEGQNYKLSYEREK